MWNRKRDSSDPLNDYWNRLGVIGPGDLPDQLAESLEPGEMFAINKVHRLHYPNRPDPDFLVRLENDIMSAFALKENATVPLSVSKPAATNGHYQQRQRRRMVALPGTGRNWRLAQAALAVLLIAAIIGGYFYFTSGNDQHPALVPAVNQATPTATDWPQFRSGPAHTGYTDAPGPAGDLNLRWTFTTDEVVNSVVSAGDRVYAYGRKGDLYALDIATGDQIWAVDLSPSEFSEENRYSAPAVDNGLVITGTFEGRLVALDAETGNLVWQQSLSSEPITTSPTVADGVIYIGNGSDALLALNAGTGEPVWSYPVQIGFSNPTVADGKVFLINSRGVLKALNADSGSELWTSDFDLGLRVPAYQDGVLYIAGSDNAYHAIDANTGNALWTTDAGTDQTLNPVVTPNMLIGTIAGGTMQAHSLVDGKTLWTAPDPGGTASPHASQTTVYAVSPDRTAYVAYDLETGAELGSIALTDVGSTAAISGDTLILSGNGEQGIVRSIGSPVDQVNEVTAGESITLDLASESSTPVSAPSAPESIGSTPVAEAGSFDQSQVILVWQTSGDSSSPFQHAGGVGISPSGEVYVGNLGANTFEIFATDGTFLRTWGEVGSGPGQFMSPESVGFDADGNIYVFDFGNHRIQKFAPDGTFLLQWGSEGSGNGQFGEVHGMVDPVGRRVYTADFLNNRIQVFDLDGNFLDKWGSTGYGPGKFRNPTMVSVDNDGNVWVGEGANGSGARLQQFDQNGTWLTEIGSADGVPASFTEVWGAAIDKDGNLFIPDYWNNAIHIYDQDLNLIGDITDIPGAGSFNHPILPVFDAEGYLYVTDFDNGRVLKLQIPDLK